MPPDPMPPDATPPDATPPDATPPDPMPTDPAPVPRQTWAEILDLLPALESGQPLYRIHDRPATIDPYDYGPELCRWRSALEQSPFPIRFDWPQWLDVAQALEQDPARLAQADLLTLRKLLTYYLRCERFTSGTLAQLIDSGKLLCILRRLAELSGQEAGK
jgi:O-acetyl-ADP-ribose deacetylase